MSSLNRATIIGNLGRDPEVRSFQNGGKVVNLRVATSRSWKDKTTGERREKTEWHSIAIFNEHLCKVAEQYLRKGSKVLIEGSIETRKWQDQSGADRYTTEIVLGPYEGLLKLFGEREAGDGEHRQDRTREEPPAAQNRHQSPSTNAPAGGNGPGGFYEDDIPF